MTGNGMRLARLDGAQAEPALAAAVQASVAALQPGEVQPLAVAAGTAPLSEWPEHAGQHDLTPWLLRRLRLVQREATMLTLAVAGLLAYAADHHSESRKKS